MRKTGYLLCADSQLLQQKEKLFPFFLRKRGEKSRELFSAGVFHFMPAFLPCFCQGNQHDPFIPFVSASEDKAIISSFASCSERDCGRMARWSANAV